MSVPLHVPPHWPSCSLFMHHHIARIVLVPILSVARLQVWNHNFSTVPKQDLSHQASGNPCEGVLVTKWTLIVECLYSWICKLYARWGSKYGVKSSFKCRVAQSVFPKPFAIGHAWMVSDTKSDSWRGLVTSSLGWYGCFIPEWYPKWGGHAARALFLKAGLALVGGQLNNRHQMDDGP